MARPDGGWPAATPRANFLAGCRVLELSVRASAAYACRLLALLGADVTRVDVPAAPDCRPDEAVGLRLSFDEYKTVIEPADEPALDRALTSCDLVIADCSSDDAAGGATTDLAAALLRRISPRVHLIESPSPAGGAAGPGSSLTSCAEGGMSWAIGDEGQPPLTLPFDVPDYLTGTELAAAAALVLATADPAAGTGQRWSIAVADVISYYVGQISSNFVPYGRPWHRDGPRATQSGGSYPAAMFRCKDGWMSVMCRTQPEWHGLIAALGRTEWLTDDRYQDSRVVARQYADELDPVVNAWCAARTRAEVFEAGRLHGFPVAPVLTVGEALEEEQFRHRRFFTRLRPEMLSPGSPFRVTDAPASGPAARGPAAAAAAGSSGAARAGARPLTGLRVLDLAWVWSGPMVTASLADLGAEVIKIENSKRPDPSRQRGRAYRDGRPVDGPELEVTPYHNQMNRGKRSVEIDIATDEGAALVRSLAARCDVVVENMRPGVLARRQLDYANLSAGHPEIVMVSLSMLGQTGPLSDIRGYAVVMSALAGLDALIGYGPDRLIGTFNPALGDPNGAGHGLAAVLSALYRARRTGQGAWIDVSQVEALLSILRLPVLRAQSGAPVLPPANAHAAWWPHGVYRCAGDDSWLAVACRNPAERSTLTAWCGAAADDRRDELEASLGRHLAAADAGRAAAELTARGVPAAPVATYETLLARDGALFDRVTHQWLGEQPLFGLPWRRDRERFPVQRPAPLLGADTGQVLTEVLGLTAGQVSALQASGVIGPRS